MEQNNFNVDCTLEGIKQAVDRQKYPAADTAAKMGVERHARGHVVSLTWSQYNALLAMAEGGDAQASWQMGYDKGFIAGYDQRDAEVKAALA